MDDSSGIKQLKLIEGLSIGIKLRGIDGKIASNDIKRELGTWKCTHKLLGVLFDTTSCSTGAKNGDCFFYRKC